MGQMYVDEVSKTSVSLHEALHEARICYLRVLMCLQSPVRVIRTLSHWMHLKGVVARFRAFGYFW